LTFEISGKAEAAEARRYLALGFRAFGVPRKLRRRGAAAGLEIQHSGFEIPNPGSGFEIWNLRFEI
jgi:hypothetical protein